MLIIAGVLGLFVVGVLAMSALFVVLSWDQPVHADDRTRVATVDDLAPYFQTDFEIDPTLEKLSKTKYFDGSMDIDYEYEEPERRNGSIYLSVTAAKERRAQDAKASLIIAWTSAVAAMRLLPRDVEVTITESDVGFRCCDESRFAVIEADGLPIGNLFTAREGKKTYLLILSGAAFATDDNFGGFVGRSLNALRKW